MAAIDDYHAAEQAFLNFISGTTTNLWKFERIVNDLQMYLVTHRASGYIVDLHEMTTIGAIASEITRINNKSWATGRSVSEFVDIINFLLAPQVLFFQSAHGSLLIDPIGLIEARIGHLQ